MGGIAPTSALVPPAAGGDVIGPAPPKAPPLPHTPLLPPRRRFSDGGGEYGQVLKGRGRAGAQDNGGDGVGGGSRGDGSDGDVKNQHRRARRAGGRCDGHLERRGRASVEGLASGTIPGTRSGRASAATAASSAGTPVTDTTALFECSAALCTSFSQWRALSGAAPIALRVARLHSCPRDAARDGGGAGPATPAAAAVATAATAAAVAAAVTPRLWRRTASELHRQAGGRVPSPLPAARASVLVCRNNWSQCHVGAQVALPRHRRRLRRRRIPGGGGGAGVRRDRGGGGVGRRDRGES